MDDVTFGRNGPYELAGTQHCEVWRTCCETGAESDVYEIMNALFRGDPPIGWLDKPVHSLIASLPSVVVDRCAVRFVPRENGVHWVHVRHSSLPVPGSPFRCIVGARDCDVSLVTAHGRGLSAGHIGNTSFSILTYLSHLFCITPSKQCNF